MLADHHRVEESITVGMVRPETPCLLRNPALDSRESGGGSDGNGDSDNGLTEIRSP